MPEGAPCPKCSKAMIRGFIPEFSHKAVASFWVKGEPKTSFLGSLKIPEEAFSIVTFRCESCGFLESYANETFVD